jgi:CSLREA domain-containing protein
VKRRLLLLGFPATLFLLLIGAFVLIRPARASMTINVTTTLDQDGAGGGCSLREAIIAANQDIAFGGCPAGNGADIIILPAGTYVLTHSVKGDNTAMTGDLDITSTVTLSGTGAALTIVDGNGFDRVIDILTTTVQFKGVTIRNGNSDTQDGGGMRISATSAMTFTDSALVANATADGGDGGGLYNAGTVMLINSAVLSNTTVVSQENGGGLYNAPTHLTPSAISVNRVGRSGGALCRNSGTVTLSNVTITITPPMQMRMIRRWGRHPQRSGHSHHPE